MTLRASLRMLLLALIVAVPAGLGAPAHAFSLFMMSEAEEARLGAEEHPKIVAEFGGTYDDPDIGFWVAQVGARVAADSEYADRSFTFTVLDSPAVNAFALPGGYVYITRGLLALMNTEAELAGVLGHEIGHVTARHTASRMSNATTANLLLGVLGIATGSQELTQIGGLIGAGILAQYSQDQEYEADRLGIGYMARAGFNPFAQADLLSSLLRERDLAQAISGSGPTGSIEGFFASHPNTLSRVRKAYAQAQQVGAGGAAYGRDDLLQRIDGMVYGHSREQGFVRDREFLHPVQRFAFTAPPGFRLVNQAEAVIAKHDDGSLVRLDIAAKPASSDPYLYLTRQWAKDARLSETGRITVNGMPGATAATGIDTQQGRMQARLVVVRHPSGKLYRLLFAAPPDRFAGHREGFQRTTYSFRQLGRGEADALQPLRLGIAQVRPGDTAESLAQRMAVPDRKVERFRVLNALDDSYTLAPGDRVKLVRDR